MAKSLRSKRKRKMRAAKRVRYGVKELDKLKNMLEMHVYAEVDKHDIDMKNVEDIKKKEPDVAEASKQENVGEEHMEVDKRVFNLKTMKDQNGSYPVWLNIRKIRKLAGKNKNIKIMKRQRIKKSGKVKKRQK